MDTPARLLLPLLLSAALGGCGALEFMGGLGDDGTDPTVPTADPQLDGELPEKLFGVAARIGDILIDDDPWDPNAPRPLPHGGTTAQADATYREVGQDDQVIRVEARTEVDECPYMPTAGLARPRFRRGHDVDSIRKLDSEVVDSLAAAGALPRTDSVIVLNDIGPTTRMPVVPIDSAGHPIRVVPLCRVTRRVR